MNRYLLDAHALMWALERSSALSENVLTFLNDEAHIILISTVSTYEIALKVTLGKLPALPRPFRELVTEADFAILPANADHFERAGKLRLINLDP